MTDFVTYHDGETLEDTFRRSDGDEFGYQVPVVLIDHLEALDRARQAAVNAIKVWIANHRVLVLDLDTEEPTGEEYPW